MGGRSREWVSSYWILDRSDGRVASDFETVLLTSRQVNDARSSDNCPRRPRLRVLLHEHGKVRATAHCACHFQRALREHARSRAVHRLGRGRARCLARQRVRGHGTQRPADGASSTRPSAPWRVGSRRRLLPRVPCTIAAMPLEFNGRSFLLPASASIARDYDVLTQGIIAKSLVDSLIARQREHAASSCWTCSGRRPLRRRQHWAASPSRYARRISP